MLASLSNTSKITLSVTAATTLLYALLYWRELKRVRRIALDDGSSDKTWLEKNCSFRDPKDRNASSLEKWLYTPFVLARGLYLRNRFIKAATFEGAAKDGLVTPELIKFHVEQSQTVGMTTVSYGCVSSAITVQRKFNEKRSGDASDCNGLTFSTGTQLLIRDTEECRKGLKQLCDDVHSNPFRYSAMKSSEEHNDDDDDEFDFAEEQTPSKKNSTNKPNNNIPKTVPPRISIQLTHAGLMAEQGDVVGPNLPREFSLGALKFARGLSTQDVEELIKRFADAAQICRECGFDAVEIHAGHSYLLSQFLSPYMNKRPKSETDPYNSSSVETRARFTIEVIRAVRKAVGEDFPILIKMNVLDLLPENPQSPLIKKQIDAAAHAASLFLSEAGADIIVPSCGLILENGIGMMRGEVPRLDMMTKSASFVKKICLALLGPWLVPHFKFQPLFLLKATVAMIDQMKNHLGTKNLAAHFAYIGGVTNSRDVEAIYNSGKFHVICVARAVLRDSEWPVKLRETIFLKAMVEEQEAENANAKHNTCKEQLEIFESCKQDIEDMIKNEESTCDHCNRCIVGQMSGKLTHCVLKEQIEALNKF